MFQNCASRHRPAPQSLPLSAGAPMPREGLAPMVPAWRSGATGAKHILWLRVPDPVGKRYTRNGTATSPKVRISVRSSAWQSPTLPNSNGESPPERAGSGSHCHRRPRTSSLLGDMDQRLSPARPPSSRIRNCGTRMALVRAIHTAQRKRITRRGMPPPGRAPGGRKRRSTSSSARDRRRLGLLGGRPLERRPAGRWPLHDR